MAIKGLKQAIDYEINLSDQPRARTTAPPPLLSSRFGDFKYFVLLLMWSAQTIQPCNASGRIPILLQESQNIRSALLQLNLLPSSCQVSLSHTWEVPAAAVIFWPRH